jgi:hypothetical protein
MKFFILGDSWGLGEYRLADGRLELVPDTGLEFYLTQLGHTVTNISAGSASNFGQLRDAYWRLRDHADYDVIIWFHTEPIRDIVETVIHDPVDGPIQYPDFGSIKNYADALTYINQRNYAYAQDTIYSEFKIPFVVIGGVGRLEQSIDQYDFAKYTIHSWMQELLNLDYPLPRNQLIWNRWSEVFDTFNYSDRQHVLEELESAEHFQQLLKQSLLFPDDMHVVGPEYEKLAVRLLEIIQ